MKAKGGAEIQFWEQRYGSGSRDIVLGVEI
jgi:hypothetical protein